MYIKDIDCTKDTPVVLGNVDQPIYGKGFRIRPKVEGKTVSILRKYTCRNYCHWKNMT